MMSDYQVLFAGIKSGWDAELAQKGLAELFAVSVQDVRQLLARTPVVIRRGLTLEHAEGLRNRVRAAGGVCRVARIDENPLAPSSQWADPDSQFANQLANQAPARSINPANSQAIHQPSHLNTTAHDPASVVEAPKPVAICPKCGYSAFDPRDPLLTAYGGQGECPQCGIVVAKYHAATNNNNIATESTDLEPQVWDNQEANGLSKRLLTNTLGGVLLAAFLAPLSFFAYNQWVQGATAPKLTQQEKAALISAATVANLTAEKMHQAGEALPVGNPYVDPKLMLPDTFRVDPWGLEYRLSISGLGEPELVSAGPNQVFELEVLGGDDLLVFSSKEVDIVSLREALPKLFDTATRRHSPVLLRLLQHCGDPHIEDKVRSWLDSKPDILLPSVAKQQAL